MNTTAQIIDAHRSTGRWMGNGVQVECACGHLSPGKSPDGPQTNEDNAHRDADRNHAQHVADMLAAQEPTDAEVVDLIEDRLHDAGVTGIAEASDGEIVTTVDATMAEVLTAACAALSAARAARRDEEKR